MKIRRLLVVILPLAFLLIVSCMRTRTIVVSKPLPPGHAKKITGSKSAKPYAPGQKKKHK